MIQEHLEEIERIVSELKKKQQSILGEDTINKLRLIRQRADLCIDMIELETETKKDRNFK